ncbi:hypothetical protein RRG08_038066 [Elysia crispata]|uniref:Uncharacterized protein n=1 Tax=Elysia crispata TaxID=231223 RepID=A0AAE0ZYW5_9GAST|nr:hypothetical protein RRG08_038066 [Elysia crispata]
MARSDSLSNSTALAHVNRWRQRLRKYGKDNQIQLSGLNRGIGTAAILFSRQQTQTDSKKRGTRMILATDLRHKQAGTHGELLTNLHWFYLLTSAPDQIVRLLASSLRILLIFSVNGRN